MKKYNLIVAQSGGPTVAINATLAGVIEQVRKSDEIKNIYGAIHGIDGVLTNNLISLDKTDTEILTQTPSAYLGSCRRKLPDFEADDSIYKDIFRFFKEKNIKYFLYIGGNDSMDTVCKLSGYAEKMREEIYIIGVPKTIDNDLFMTDHTPGFGSAAKYIAATVHDIVRDSQVYHLKSVTIIEIMGRNAGWLTAASALARTKEEKAPHLIYLPEVAFSNEKFISDIHKNFSKGINNIVVAVSEGIKYENGKFVSENENGALDAFGHKSLCGAGKYLENLIKNEIGCKVRSVELNVCQRCAGYILSKTDISESKRIGAYAVRSALHKKTGQMMAFERISNDPYKVRIKGCDISKIANIEKKVDVRDIINGNDVSKRLIEYLRPLIMGEVRLKYVNGIPKTLYRKLQK